MGRRGRRPLRGGIWSACSGTSRTPSPTGRYLECVQRDVEDAVPYGCCRLFLHAGGRTTHIQGRNGSAWCNGEHIAEMRVRVPPPASSLSLMGHDGCESSAALGIRAGEDPAIYGGVVQAASHDPGEGEARAHIREKQVRGLPPPIGTGWTTGDGP